MTDGVNCILGYDYVRIYQVIQFQTCRHGIGKRNLFFMAAVAQVIRNRTSNSMHITAGITKSIVENTIDTAVPLAFIC